MGKTNAVLIDTHIFLWFLDDNTNLSKKASEVLTDPSIKIFLSVSTIWEIIVKKSKGKLKTPSNLQKAIDACGFDILPIELPHVLKLAKLPNYHQDPFDRILIAQALIEKCTLVTTDAKIKKYKVPVIG